MALAALEAARLAVEAASEKLATNIVLLDMRNVATFTDYFLICSGDSEKQLTAIYDAVEETLKKAGVKPCYREGSPDSGWMLLDYGDFVVHIFSPFEREYYQIDELWSESTPILRIQ